MSTLPRRHIISRLAVVLLASGFACGSLLAQGRPTGIIKGRVANAAGGTYLNHAQVRVTGSNLETLTDDNGAYQITGVPVGDAVVVAGFAGFAPQTAVVHITGGAVAEQSFELALLTASTSGAEEPVKLSQFTVEAQRMSGEAIARQEQKSAPNIKNVVSVDEFPNIGEGNVGEYLQFVPGVSFLYNPQSPATASIRGMPASGTIVTIDGAEVASSLPTTRSFDFAVAGAGNIERIEVTKEPTPDLPANAVGGSINLISKTALSRRTPLFTYNIYATDSTLDGIHGPSPIFGDSHGPNNRTTISRIQPALDLSYILPVNKSLGFTFALSKSRRYSDWDVLRNLWDRIKLVQTSSQDTLTGFREDKELYQAGVDWKPSENNTLRFSAKYTRQLAAVTQNSIIGNYGANATNDPASVQGAATGVGSAQMGYGWNNQYKPLGVISLSHRYTGSDWTFESNASWSKGSFKAQDEPDGFFGNLSASIPNLVVSGQRTDAITDRKVPLLTAFDRTGKPVNIYDANNYTLSAATSSYQSTTNQIRVAAFNAIREFHTSMPFQLKAGFNYNERVNESNGVAKTYTFTPPGGGSNLVGKFDLINTDFSTRPAFADIGGQPVYANWLSLPKLEQLARQHPDWFVLNQAAAYTSGAGQSKKMREDIPAAYIRGDVRLFSNRLWLVGGVRFEQTEDHGVGPLNNPGAAYLHDASGKIVNDSTGKPVFATSDLLQRAILQTSPLGSRNDRKYDGCYPSLNASYTITDQIVVRAAYAKTIGRPELTEIIPGITITDPSSTAADKTITVINTGLKPWSANNYDLSLESYNIKNAVASISVFRKELHDFFSVTESPVTPDFLAQYGLPNDYLAYNEVTKLNKGAAAITGVEAGYQQALTFLPGWGRGLQIFANLTSMAVTGPNRDDLNNFMPRTLNWGINFLRPSFDIKLSVMNRKWNRVSPTAASATVGPNSYAYYAPQTKIDLSMEYRFSRELSLVGSVRNLGGDGLRRGTWSSATPAYARVDQIQYTGALWSIGIKGEF